jgi:hypothetical protein
VCSRSAVTNPNSSSSGGRSWYQAADVGDDVLDLVLQPVQ